MQIKDQIKSEIFSELVDIINNEAYKQIRENHINGLFLSKCSSCDMAEVKDMGPKPTYVKIG